MIVDFVGLASAVFFQCLRQAVDEYVEIGVCAVPSGYKQVVGDEQDLIEHVMRAVVCLVHKCTSGLLVAFHRNCSLFQAFVVRLEFVDQVEKVDLR